MYYNKLEVSSNNDIEIAFNDYHEMEILFEKLKSLDYYTEFVIPFKVKPINSYYFMIPTNSGEHFFLFCQLVTWLIRKSGKHFDEPHDFEDPNNTISRILTVVREDGTTIDFPPNKLKPGTGRHVVFILNKLCDAALRKNEIKLVAPTFVENENEENLNNHSLPTDNESEIILDQIEDDMFTVYSDYSDDDEINGYDLTKTKVGLQNKNVDLYVNEELWQKELERVVPSLRIFLKNNVYDWRTRLNFMQDNYDEIKQNVLTAKAHISKIHKRLTYNIEKIKNREKHLNKEFEFPLKNYMDKLYQLSKAKEKYNELGSGMNEKMRNLTLLSQTLDNYKQKAEIRGSFVTDGTPLVNIKKGISKMKSDIATIDVRIGVLQCFLFNTELNEKSRLEKVDVAN